MPNQSFEASVIVFFRSRSFRVVVHSLCIALMVYAPVDAAKRPDALVGIPDENSVNLIYDPGIGTISLDVGDNLSPDPFFTAFQIKSGAGLFQGAAPAGFDTSFFDIYVPKKSFYLDGDGFSDVPSLGNVGPGRAGAELMSDFLVDAAKLPSGDLDNVNVNIVLGVPVLMTTPASGGSVNFGNVLLGQSANRLVTVENNGFVELSGRFPAASGEFAPKSGSNFGPLMSDETAQRTYTYTPTDRGRDNQGISITSDTLDNQKSDLTLTGRGVAPVTQVSTNGGQTRVGTSGTTRLQVENIGDGNLSGLGGVSNAQGNVERSTGIFSGIGGGFSLADGASESFDYTFTPSQRGTATADIDIQLSNGSGDGRNRSQTVSQTLRGTGVGPVFDSPTHGSHINRPNSPIAFGEVDSVANLSITLVNSTSDVANNPNLVGLTLLAEAFDNDSPFRLLQNINTVLDPQERFTFNVEFNPSGLPQGSIHTDTLTFKTDQDSAFGNLAGNSAESFTFSFTGTAARQNIPGDFDGDRDLDVNDINALTAAVSNKSNDLKFDVNGDGRVGVADRRVWVNTLKGTYFGDSNLNGQFDTSDLNLVFQAGKYEDGIEDNASWREGDWDGDGDFGTDDLLLAFSEGSFEKGPRTAVNSVPEPSCRFVVLFAFLLVASRLRSRVRAC